MAEKRHTAEEIVSKLRQIDVLMAQGRHVADAVRAITDAIDSRRSREAAERPRRALPIYRAGVLHSGAHLCPRAPHKIS